MRQDLYLGNNIEILDSIDMDWSKTIFVTDPPFNIGYHYHTYKDRMPKQDYWDFIKLVMRSDKQVLIHYTESLFEYAISIGQSPTKFVSWVYNSNTAKQHRGIAFWNVIPDFRKVGQPYKNPNDKRISKRIAEGKKARLYDWWNINQVKNVSKEKTEHPAQMPLEVMENIIGILPEGYTIVDPFMGSGTTALACKKYNRDFIGIEMDELYFNIAQKRLNEEAHQDIP